MLADPDQSEYLKALGAFRQQSLIWAAAARELGMQACKADPDGSAAAHPLAEMTFREVAAELRSVALANPGLRELFAAAIGGV